MSPVEITVIALAAALVAFTVAYNIIRKKKGKTSCGCDSGSSGCSHCSGCLYEADCHKKKECEK